MASTGQERRGELVVGLENKHIKNILRFLRNSNTPPLLTVARYTGGKMRTSSWKTGGGKIRKSSWKSTQ